MIKKIKAFSLSEVLLTMALVATLGAIMLPILKNVIPDEDVVKFKQVYFGTLSIINSMANDALFFPDARGFANFDEIYDSDVEEYYPGREKFTFLFKDNLNLMSETPVPVGGTFPYALDEDANGVFTVKNSSNISCYKNTAGAVYCIPPNVDVFNPDKPGSNDLVLIRVYTNSKSFDISKAFFIGVYADGRVDLPLSIPGYVDCANSETFRSFNQCQANDYLASKLID